MLKQSVKVLTVKHLQYLFCSAALFCIFAFAAAARSQTTITSFEDSNHAQQDVFYRGIDQNIYFRYYNSAQGWQIQNLSVLSGAPLAAPGTSVTSFEDPVQNQQHVMFEAIDGHIYHLYSNSNPSAWYVQDLTSLTGSNGAAVGTPLFAYCDTVNDVQYVFYISANQDVSLLYWHGSWNAEDVTSIAAAAPAMLGTKLTGFHEDVTQVVHIFYEGADQHVHELYSRSDPTDIGQTDNSGSSGATLAVAGSGLASTFDYAKRQEDVYFEDVNQHIQHLYFTYTEGVWHSEDLTALEGETVTAAATSISAFQDSVTGRQHVVYVGADQHVHQFFASVPWELGDLTIQGNAPQVSSLISPLTSFKDDPDGQQHVFYLGADLHFYHLYYTDQWNSEDITAGAVIPAF